MGRIPEENERCAALRGLGGLLEAKGPQTPSAPSLELIRLSFLCAVVCIAQPSARDSESSYKLTVKGGEMASSVGADAVSLL